MTNATAKIQATVNGATVTLAEVAICDISIATGSVMTNNQTVTLALTRPVKINPGTAVNLVTVQNAGATAGSIASACVHYFTHDKGSNVA